MVNRFVSFLAPEHPNNRIESLEICCILVETNVLGIPEIQQHELPQKVTTYTLMQSMLSAKDMRSSVEGVFPPLFRQQHRHSRSAQDTRLYLIDSEIGTALPLSPSTSMCQLVDQANKALLLFRVSKGESHRKAHYLAGV